MPSDRTLNMRKERSLASPVSQHFFSCGKYEAVVQIAAMAPIAVVASIHVSCFDGQGLLMLKVAIFMEGGGAQPAHRGGPATPCSLWCAQGCRRTVPTSPVLQTRRPRSRRI